MRGKSGSIGPPVTLPFVSEISVPAESRYVGIARNFVVEVAHQSGWVTETQLDDLRLVASEMVTNAIRAQQLSQTTAHIFVRCSVTDSEVELQVADAAGGLDTRELENLAVIDPTQEGGFGLHLISRLSDEAHFERVGSGTSVRTVMFRNGISER
ncbi:MAG TPA: hypothetical protein DEG43_10095 [Acidimicrobiaceae bacterium]|jgi:anti-sigma regulatory factor (Ser/Thr protein kinase)|nr:hypothetical protein [Acidimicrobiaceae bacterium]